MSSQYRALSRVCKVGGRIGFMSGHSKWSTIKHKKAVVDAKRGKIFTKIARMITMAVKNGSSGDPVMNPALRVAIDKGREANMPKDNIQRAIDRGLGKGGERPLEEIVYEGYGPGGVGIIVSTVTDNRNRTAAEVKNVFEKSGGSLGSPGSVAYLRSITPVPMIQLEKGEAERVSRLLEELDGSDDVIDVWSNLAVGQ